MIPDGQFRKSGFSQLSNCLEAAWRKSSVSGPFNDACVEARCPAEDVVEVRNSREPYGPILSFTGTEWDAFVAGVKQGEFDRVTE